MKPRKHLESFAYCALLVLLSSILISLTTGVWMMIYAGVTHG